MTLCVSPAMMMFDRDLTLLIDLAVGRPVRDNMICVIDHAYLFEQKLFQIHKLTRRYLNIQRDSMTYRYSLKTQYRLTCNPLGDGPQMEVTDASPVFYPPLKVTPEPTLFIYIHFLIISTFRYISLFLTRFIS